MSQLFRAEVMKPSTTSSFFPHKVGKVLQTQAAEISKFFFIPCRLLIHKLAFSDIIKSWFECSSSQREAPAAGYPDLLISVLQPKNCIHKKVYAVMGGGGGAFLLPSCRTWTSLRTLRGQLNRMDELKL